MLSIVIAFTIHSFSCVAINFHTRSPTLSDSPALKIDDYLVFPSSCCNHPTGMKLLPTNEDYIFSYLPDKLEEGNIKAIGALIKEPVAKDQLNELLDTGSLEIKPPFVPPMELSGDGKNYNDEVKGTTEILNGANPETEVSSNEKEDSELRDNLIQNLSEVNASKTMFGAN